MNESSISEFVEQTEEYVRNNRSSLRQVELDSLSDLYDDLTAEFDRSQLFEDLYH